MAESAIDKLTRLHAEQQRMISTYPEARSELLDFHYKDHVESYHEAIDAFAGRKFFAAAKTPLDAASLVRKSVLVSDLVVLNVDDYIGHPALALVPIGDDVASEVLGASAMMDPATGNYSFAPAAVFMAGMGMSMLSAVEKGDTTQIIGCDWSGTEDRMWKRTTYARLADAMQDKHGNPCHVAGGLIHVQLPKDESLLEEASQLMSTGRLVYAPFLGALSATSPDYLLVKSAMLGGSLASPTPTHAFSSPSTVLGKLEIPYLDGIPLDLLAEIIKDESESIKAFRLQFDRLLEDLLLAKDDAEALKRVMKFNRDIMEDELDKVRNALNKVARMNSVIRSGAYIGVASLSVAAYNGLVLPSLITGLSGTLAASLVAWYRSYLDGCDARRSPAHLLWQFERKAT